MRNRIMLSATFLVLAACGDKAEPTGPTTPATQLNDAPQVQDLRGPGANPAAKPVPAFSNLVYVQSEPFHLLKPDLQLTGSAVCPEGSKVVSGGYGITSIGLSRYAFAADTWPDPQANSWKVTYFLPSDAPAVAVTFYVYAVCVQ